MCSGSVISTHLEFKDFSSGLTKRRQSKIGFKQLLTNPNYVKDLDMES